MRSMISAGNYLVKGEYTAKVLGVHENGTIEATKWHKTKKEAKNDKVVGLRLSDIKELGIKVEKKKKD